MENSVFPPETTLRFMVSDESSLTVDVDFVGLGGGGMDLGGGGGIPSDEGRTSFLGAGIFDTFLTVASVDCFEGFKISESCEWN